MSKFSFHDIPRLLRDKTGSDFLAGAIVTLVSGLAFMGIIQALILAFPAN